MKRRRFYNNKKRNQKWTEPEVGRPIDFADKYDSSEIGENKFVKADNSRSRSSAKRQRSRKKKQQALITALAVLLVFTGFFCADIHMQRHTKSAHQVVENAQKSNDIASDLQLTFNGATIPSVSLDGSVMLSSVINDAQKSGKAALMFDAKRADGTIGYESALTTVETFSLLISQGKAPAESVKQFKDNDILPVARIYTYLDNSLPELSYETAFKKKNKLFKDKEGNTYLDPESDIAYAYIKDIVSELCSMGVTVFVLDGCTVNKTDYYESLISRLTSDIEADIRFYEAVNYELKGYDAESGDVNETGIKNDISKLKKPDSSQLLIIKTKLEEESYKAFLEEKGILAYIIES